ncbi:hypothetical protein ACHAXA_001872, partial [Cyclostephanos tholiformis]
RIFIITISYFSIPVQILVGLWKFPRVTRRATKQVVILLVLFALFIFLCGAGHLLRCLGRIDTNFFHILNILTAAVSFLTSIYLLSFVPILLDGADKLYLEAAATRRIVDSLYPPSIRERLLRQRRTVDVLPSFMEEGVVKDDDNLNDDGTAATKTPSTIRRIQDFIRQHKGESTIEVVSDSRPIAETYPETSIMFADISNFTQWSSMHSPNQVFTLLESLFFDFDKIAAEMEVFKLSTVGDCYIATVGVPYPRPDHAVVLVQFSERCRRKANEVLQRLVKQGEMTGISQLKIRIGIHSGPVTAGVLRGNNRFDVFGDTINTASRIESTGEPDKIHLSKETAELLKKAGKGDWITQREFSVKAKGKGDLETFWLKKLDEKGLNEPCDDCHYGQMKLQISEVELIGCITGGNDEAKYLVI